MNQKIIKLVVSIILVMIFSCDEPETVVTNIIHPDGSVTRKIEMRREGGDFDINNIQVPLDSTWVISESLEISDKGDTTWVKMAEKLFKNTDELNLAYKTDTGCNSHLKRHAEFQKNFRWFNTIYRFSETVEKKLRFGYPLSDFMNKEELLWYYSPENYTVSKMNGPDSLIYKPISDSIEKKEEEWFFRSLVAEWAGEFRERTGKQTGESLSADTIKKWEDNFMRMIKTHDKDFDSLWKSGFILSEVIGSQTAVTFKTEADSAISVVEDKILAQFAAYSVKAFMPGKLISSNGFADSSNTVLWPVSDDFFLTENYEMWAESKVPNIWAWIVSGVFVVFVITGLILRKNKGG